LLLFECIRERMAASPFLKDDRKTYGYETNGGSITRLTWDDATHQLRHEGTSPSSQLDRATLLVIGR
jgi:alpha-D-xyloside xylohydrolase